jgi:hypothetical protein
LGDGMQNRQALDFLQEIGKSYMKSAWKNKDKVGVSTKIPLYFTKIIQKNPFTFF